MSRFSGINSPYPLLLALLVALTLHALLLFGNGANPPLPETTAPLHLTLNTQPVATQPDPAPEPKPEPEPESAPTPVPTPEQAPEPIPQPKPEPKPAPQPVAVPDPAPPPVQLREQTEIKPVAPVRAEARSATPEPAKTKPVAPVKPSAPAKATPKPERAAPIAATPPPVKTSASLLANSLDFARSGALDSLTSTADSTRTRRLVSGARMSSAERDYLNHWRKKVQQIGELNYPQDEHRRKLSGTLRLLVVLDREGELVRVQILRSSGQTALDQAALRIIRLAAPFRAFPVELRKNTDRLEIVRLWKFEDDTVVY